LKSKKPHREREKNMKEEKDKEFNHLVRVAGKDIKGQMNVVFGLSLIRGIGPRTARILCTMSGIDWKKKVGYLSDKDLERIEKEIGELEKAPSWILNRRKDYASGKDRQVIGADLMLSLRDDLNRLKKIRSYRGIRHETGLPVRGQRTRSTFRKGTAVGVSRKKTRQALQKQ
jgi:small subunit ribosomal protein S13